MIICLAARVRSSVVMIILLLLVPHVVGLQHVSDETFMNWSRSNGIFAAKVELLTTSKSVGGRGLFATAELKKGEVVATIPGSLAIRDVGIDADWQSRLVSTLYERRDDSTLDTWYQTWQNLELPWLYSSNVEVSTRLKKLITDLHGTSDLERQLANEIQERRNGYQRRRDQFLATNHYDMSFFDTAYACTISRSALIPEAIAVIPFFDMLNHAASANIDLVPFARIKDECDPRISDLLDNDDLLLVALVDIPQHSELFTCYKEYTSSNSTEFVDAILALQWDIPHPTSHENG